MKKVVLGIAMLATSVPAMAQFTGDTVNGTYYFPNNSTVFSNQGNQTVSPSAMFTFLTGIPNVTATVGASTISLSFDASGTFTVASFNGLTITDLTDSDIVGVLLGSTNVAGFDASRLSFTSNSVSLNLQGLQTTSQSSIIANVSFAGAAVPEPATWAMMLVGFAGIGYTLRRRKKAALQAA
jgi:hypothetical protein